MLVLILNAYMVWLLTGEYIRYFLIIHIYYFRGSSEDSLNRQILFSFNFSIFYVISIALRVHILVYLLKGNQSCSASCVKLEKHN